ncbi:hypothetical protein ACEZ3G_07805 [Maribacter algicola]|uniref:Uncharacterized protein n=1 Tax=Meishania litoralis TaxID=3434685 RepID=A0ACC7LJF4_9FLAO
MKRIQLFEFEDFSWFPYWLRTCMTNLLMVLHRMMGISEVLADLITDSLKRQDLNQIVDLGSGSGGAMPEVLQLVRKTPRFEHVELILTDLYPNPEIVKKYEHGDMHGVTYRSKPVDATNISKAPQGLKTMINSFHHMPPEAARKILQSCQENRQPLLVYELAENKMPLLLWWLLLPISLLILMVMVLFMTPFVKPMTWQQLVFTYLIPIIPICYAWDGQASLPRMYAFKDIDILLEGLHSDTYTWEKGYAYKKNNKKTGTYLIGLPIG